MNKLKIIFQAASLLGILSFCSCNNDISKDKNQLTKKEYEVMKLELHPATIKWQYPASIQGRQDIEIRPRVEGYIEKILIDEGSVVKKGQTLFLLDGSQYEQNVRSADAAIKIATAEVNAAQMQVNKTKSLVDKDIVSKYELESAEYVLQSKQAALAQAKALLQNAKTNLSYTVIKSHADGVVGTITYKVGSLVNSSSTQPLTTVSDISSIYAYFSMNEKDFLTFIKDGDDKSLQQKLKKMSGISLLLADGSTYSFKGKIETVSGKINSETGTANFRADFPNPQSLIRSGSSGTITIPKTIPEALLIPQKAAYELQGKRFVYLVDGNGKLKSTEISIMSAGLNNFYIVTEGLKAGDSIVIEGVNMLNEKSVIAPKYISSDEILKNIK